MAADVDERGWGRGRLSEGLLLLCSSSRDTDVPGVGPHASTGSTAGTLLPAVLALLVHTTHYSAGENALTDCSWLPYYRHHCMACKKSLLCYKIHTCNVCFVHNYYYTLYYYYEVITFTDMCTPVGLMKDACVV